MEPLKMVVNRCPLVAAAAQITSPAPLLVQLGFDATVPTRFAHVLHAVPLNSLTIIWLDPARTAQTALPVGTNAQEGLPKPVAVPVEMKLLQAADAGWQDARAAHKIGMLSTVGFKLFFLCKTGDDNLRSITATSLECGLDGLHLRNELGDLFLLLADEGLLLMIPEVFTRIKAVGGVIFACGVALERLHSAGGVANAGHSGVPRAAEEGVLAG